MGKDDPKLDPIENLYDSIVDKYVEALVYDTVMNKVFDLKVLDKFAELVGDDARICDVGCGPEGHIGKYLYDKGLDVIGIDISAKSIENARKVNTEINFRVMDFHDMYFDNDFFDGIIAFYSLIHIPAAELESVLLELKRTLKQGGKLLIAVHKGTGECVIDEFWDCKTTYLVKWYQESELAKLLLDTGFKLKYIESRGPYDFEMQTERIYVIAEKA